jgi:ATP-dependent Clp protease ATP-binding subunit ClpA
LTPRAKKVLELSLREALQLGHNYVGTEHLLLGVVSEGEGLAAQALEDLGVELPRVRRRVLDLLGEPQGKEGMSLGDLAFPRHRGSARVGKEWTARVVRAGRRPDDYAIAYREVAELVESHGLKIDDLDASEINIASIETSEGPGLEMLVRHTVEDEQTGEAGDPGS